MNSRKYLIKEHNGLFVLSISQQEQGYYVGTVIWYEKSGEWSENTLRTDWHTKHFLDNSHEAVYDKAMEWVTKSLGAPLAVEETTNTKKHTT